MNLLQDDIEYIAARIASRISKFGPAQVYIKPSGTVSVYSTGDVRNRRCADAFRLGAYTRSVRADDIAEDLRFRRQELAA